MIFTRSTPKNSFPRDFRLFAAARTVTMIGNGFGRVALSFAILSLPGVGAAQLATALLFQSVPQIVLILFGGVLADRLSRKHVMIVSDIASTAAWAGMGAIVATHSSNMFVLLYALAAVSGVASAFMLPGSSGMISLLIEPNMRQRANSTLRTGQNLAAMVGMAGAGAAAALVGPAGSLFANAGTFLVSAALACFIRAAQSRPAPSTLLRDLRTGAREFFRHQWIWVVVTQSAFVTAVFTAEIGVLGPLVAESRLGGVSGWSWILTFQALGTVAGAAVIGRARIKRPILIATLASMLIAAPMLALAASSYVSVVAAAAFLCGAGMDVFAVLWYTALQQEVPETMISRVSSYDYLGSLIFAPVGLAAAHPIIAAFGLTETLYFSAGLVIVAAAIALLSPSVRRLKSIDEDAVCTGAELQVDNKTGASGSAEVAPKVGSW